MLKTLLQENLFVFPFKSAPLFPGESFSFPVNLLFKRCHVCPCMVTHGFSFILVSSREGSSMRVTVFLEYSFGYSFVISDSVLMSIYPRVGVSQLYIFFIQREVGCR